MAGPDSQYGSVAGRGLAGERDAGPQVGRIRRFLARTPRLVLALAPMLVLLPAWWYSHQIASIVPKFLMFAIGLGVFVAGGVQRGRWRQILLLAAVFVLQGALVFAISYRGLLSDGGYSPYRWWPHQLVPVVALVLVEGVLTGTRGVGRLFGLLLPAFALAGIWQASCLYLGSTPYMLIPLASGTAYRSWATLLSYPLLAGLVWLGLPSADALIRAGLLGRVGLVAVAVLLLCGHALFVQVALFDLARQTVRTGGPLDPAKAVWLVCEANTADDQALLLDALAHAKVDSTHVPRDSTRITIPLFEAVANATTRNIETRAKANEILLQRYRRDGGREFFHSLAYAGLLLDVPEMKPLWLRNMQNVDDAYTAEMCSKAFQGSPDWPEYGLYIEQLELERGAQLPRPATASDPNDFEASREFREAVGNLVGRDIGPNYSDGVAAIEDLLRNRPDSAPDVPPDIRDLMNQEMASLRRYYDAHARMRRARAWLTGELAGQVPPSTSTEALLEEVRRRTAVPEPDFYALSTDEFARQVDRYADAVDQVLQSLLDEYGSQGGRPASRPAGVSH